MRRCFGRVFRISLLQRTNTLQIFDLGSKFDGQVGATPRGPGVRQRECGLLMPQAPRQIVGTAQRQCCLQTGGGTRRVVCAQKRSAAHK